MSKKLIAMGAAGPNVNIDSESSRLLSSINESKKKIVPLQRIEIPEFMNTRLTPKDLKNIRLSPNDEYKRDWKCVRDIQTILDAILSLDKEPDLVKITYSVKSGKTLRKPSINMKDTKVARRRKK